MPLLDCDVAFCLQSKANALAKVLKGSAFKVVVVDQVGTGDCIIVHADALKSARDDDDVIFVDVSKDLDDPKVVDDPTTLDMLAQVAQYCP